MGKPATFVKGTTYINRRPMYRIGFPAEEHKMMDFVMHRVGKNNETWVSVERLAEDTKQSERTVRRILSSLVHKGYVEAQRRCRESTVHRIGRAFHEMIPWEIAEVGFVSDPRLTLIAQESPMAIPDKPKVFTKQTSTAAAVVATATAKKSKVAKTQGALEKVWRQTMGEIYPHEIHEKLIEKDKGMINLMFTYFSVDGRAPAVVLATVLENWHKFAHYAKERNGLGTPPTRPKPDFVAKYSNDALSFYDKMQVIPPVSVMPEKPVVQTLSSEESIEDLFAAAMPNKPKVVSSG